MVMWQNYQFYDKIYDTNRIMEPIYWIVELEISLMYSLDL